MLLPSRHLLYGSCESSGCFRVFFVSVDATPKQLVETYPFFFFCQIFTPWITPHLGYSPAR